MQPSIGQIYDIGRLCWPQPLVYLHTCRPTIFNSKDYTLYKGTLLSECLPPCWVLLVYLLAPLWARLHFTEMSVVSGEQWQSHCPIKEHCLFVCMYWQWSICILTGCDNVLCARTVAVCIEGHFDRLFAKCIWRGNIENYTMHTTAFDTRAVK